MVSQPIDSPNVLLLKIFADDLDTPVPTAVDPAACGISELNRLILIYLNETALHREIKK
jgi:hypothetical protein